MPIQSVRRPTFAPLKRLHNGKTLPPAHWRPYPRASIYKPIVGTGDGSVGSPSVHASSAAIIAKMTTPGNPSQMLPGEDSASPNNNPPVSHPVYFANHTDPLFTVNQRTGGNASDWWGTQIRFPQSAKPPQGGADAHMASVQPDGTEWFIYDASSNVGGTPLTSLPGGGGIIYGQGFAKHRIDGDGAPIGSGDATAARWPAMFGQIRVEEMYARLINHAIFATVNFCDGQFVAPAYKAGRGKILTTNGAHTFPMTGGTINFTSMRVDTSGSASIWSTTSGAARLPNGSVVTYTGITGTAASGTLTGCNGGTGGSLAGGSTLNEHNWPPLGARLQLNMSQSAIDAIADSGNSSGRWWNKTLLTALRKYGMFFGDTGGGNWGLQLFSGTSQFALTGTDPWRTWASATSPAMNYSATDDVYLWDIRTVVSWASNLRVLDWTDPLNH